jgi:hypothetical protein
MPKQRLTTEEIIHKLREADVMSGQGKTVADFPIKSSAYFDYASSPTGNSAGLKGTPQAPIPRYPLGFFPRYCW